MHRCRGYLTVYLCVCLVLILSLYLVLIEGARRNGAQLEAVCAAEAGINGILAEYHRELADQYNIYAIDSSYGTYRSGRNNTEAHLLKYLEKNLDYSNLFLGEYLYRDFFGLRVEDCELVNVGILTDNDGAAFRGQAIAALGSDFGLGVFEQLQQWTGTIQVNGLDTRDLEAEKKNLEKQLSEYNSKSIDEKKTVKKPVENPIGDIPDIPAQGILNLIMSGDKVISGKYCPEAELFSERAAKGLVSCGNMQPEDKKGLLDRFLFQEYLLRYMGCYVETKEDSALDYQIEYLICGGESDVENLKKVLNRLLLLREAANAVYLATDETKKVEIETASIVVSTILLSPELEPVIKGLIVCGWAGMESLYDLKCLLKGQRIPLIKDEKSWHYGLTQALKGLVQEADEETEGLSYQDYLRVFMMLTDLKKLTYRAMNQVEADIRRTKGNEAFRLDACYYSFDTSIRMRDKKDYEITVERHREY